jgi:hypothetical protein
VTRNEPSKKAKVLPNDAAPTDDHLQRASAANNIATTSNRPSTRGAKVALELSNQVGPELSPAIVDAPDLVIAPVKKTRSGQPKEATAQAPEMAVTPVVVLAKKAPKARQPIVMAVDPVHTSGEVTEALPITPIDRSTPTTEAFLPLFDDVPESEPMSPLEAPKGKACRNPC